MFDRRARARSIDGMKKERTSITKFGLYLVCYEASDFTGWGDP